MTSLYDGGRKSVSVQKGAGTAESSDLEDCALAKAAAAGDAEAFDTLFQRYGRTVARIGSRFFRSPAEVEEVIQETFLRAFLALDGFRPERASFATWLNRITVNFCYDELRRRQRRRTVSLEDERSGQPIGDDLRSSSTNPEALAIGRDLAGKLLGLLDPKDRVILIMLEVEGWAVAEIAEALGWSRTRVKVRAHRARMSLRTLLGRSL